MPKKLLFLSLAFLLATAIMLMAMPGERQKATSLIDNPTVQAPSTRATCTMTKTDGAPTTYFMNIDDGTGFYTYFDPAAECAATPTYPFEITAFTFALYDYAGAGTATVDIVVYYMAPSGLICDGPGGEKCRRTMTVTSFFPYTVTYTFPTPCCVTEPFFIGIEYPTGTPDVTPSVLMDGQTSDTCVNWMNDAGSFVEFYDFWYPPPPGYPLFWVDGETQSADCQQPCTWQPGDLHKMHFPQLPDESGWDVNATQPLVLADDFLCTWTGPVKDIHFWGSWKNGIEGEILYFVLSLHEDIPADPPQIPYSRPGTTLWEREVSDFSAIPRDPPSSEGWYDPSTGEFIYEDHQAYFQYDICFDNPNDWFIQSEGTIYWLNIAAVVADPANTVWGWKSTQDHWNDDAVWAYWGELNWIDLWEPSSAVSLDLSFVITGKGPDDSGACCYDPTGGNQDMACIYTTQAECEQTLGGVYEGTGVPCTAPQACCLPDGTCVMADPLCCQNELGGVPWGTGSQCTQTQACCMPGGFCQDLDPLCCANQGGVPQGAGSQCTQAEGCCFADGSCQNLDPLCCVDRGGVPQGPGTQCIALEACCMPDGSCQMLDPLCCDDQGGTPQGPYSDCDSTIACCMPDNTCRTVSSVCCDDLGGTPSPLGLPVCLGDNDGDGFDDACVIPDDLKWRQAPDLDPTGMDVDASCPSMYAGCLINADDFLCTSNGPITEIHVFGSWLDDEYPFNDPGSAIFTLSIHRDVLAGVDLPWSHPGEVLWTHHFDIAQYTVRPYATDIVEGWYEPMQDLYEPYADFTCWEYIFVIPEDSQFVQMGSEQEPVIYWLDVQANPLSMGMEYFGWKTSLDHWNDDAVWGQGEEPNFPPDVWQEMRYPAGHAFATQSIDLAFEIYSPTSCDCIPGDGDGIPGINIADAVYLINYIFKAGPAPQPYPRCSGDATCDCTVNVGDAVYLINYIFKGGPPPCDCQTWLSTCGPPSRK